LAGYVWTLALSGDNLYVGGNFVTANNTGGALTVSYLTYCSITADCAQFYQTGGGSYGVGAIVNSLIVSGDNLYIGGQFTTANNTDGALTVNRLTRCSIAASCAEFYQTGGGTYGANNTVNALVVSGDNLYLGGTFLTLGNAGGDINVNRVGRCSITAGCAQFYPTNGGSYGLNNAVNALAISGDKLYLGGAFTAANNTDGALNVYRLTYCSLSSNCSKFYQTGGGNFGLNGVVNALVVSGDDLYVGGAFITAANSGGALTVNRLTRCSISADCAQF
jgi:hypothetical protein